MGVNSDNSDAIKKAVLESLEHGASRTAACAAAGCSRDWFYSLLKTDEDFKAAVVKAEECAVHKVEGALFDAATHINNAGNFNLGAQMAFLCNRAPDRWKHVNRVQLEGAAGGEALRIVLENAWGKNGKDAPRDETGALLTPDRE